ncbi:dockerin type I repeat-containing protein [Eubacterium sp.]|uniref:dockerin type I repeat-containing protein n=1 Tax=Eubacterium sp. TaxID=142586 RepID=UPI0026E02673|nr:dockerin type I repeat-containing protein [Eubacterium sp.]MDO5434689.1 dockerin type I repeat-containing protein [Eubacterium sp.]
MKIVQRGIVLLGLLIFLASSFVSLIPRALAESKPMSYDKYCADWYARDKSTINFYLNQFAAPYQTYVDNVPKEFQTELAAWKVGSLGIEAGATYSTEQVDFYQLLLFDVLWQEFSNPTYASECEKNLKMLDLSVIKDLNNLDKSITLSTKITEENAGEILSKMQSIDGISGAIKFKDTLQKYIGYVTNVEDLVERVCKIQMLLNLPEESANILKDMLSSTSDMAMSYALTEFSGICSGQISEEAIIALFTSEKALNVATKEVLSKTWETVLKASPLKPIYWGQQVGKHVSNVFLGTDKIVDSYYSMQMLCNFQNILKEKVLRYEANYKSSPTEANARIFNQSIAMYLKTMNAGMDYSVRFVEAVKEGGVINYLYSVFNQNKYDDVLKTLKRIQSGINDEIKFFNSDVRNMYNDEYGIEMYPIAKEPQEMTRPEFDASITQLRSDVFKITNLTIKEDLKLTSDMETYGDVILENGTLNLNGHALTVGGNLLQKDGIIDIDGGTLNVGGYYAMAGSATQKGDGSMEYGAAGWAYLKMTTAADRVNVDGDFIAYSTSGNTDLSNGELRIKGNFMQKVGDSYNFSASGKHKTIFCGSQTQKISFDSYGSSGFADLRFENPNIILEKGIRGFTLKDDVNLTIGTETFGIDGTLDTNGHSIGETFEHNGNLILEYGKLILNGKPVRIVGNLEMAHGEIDLKGSSLTVEGNLLQKDGIIDIDGGTLNVGGYYAMAGSATQKGDGSMEYGAADSACLKMTSAADRVNVDGDFIAYSTSSNRDLSNGELRIKGNFMQKVRDSYNFSASGKHKTILIGDGAQSISFESYPNSGFNILQLTKERSNYTFNPDPCWKTLIENKKHPDAPEAPSLESKTHNSITLKEKAGCEYSMDKVNWQASNVFTELQAETEYCFYQRYAETETAFASDASDGLTVTTNKEPVKGDLNGNGVIDVMDARKAKRAAMKSVALTPDEIKLVDLNGDGKVDIMEARKIKRAAMKEIVLE